MIKDNQELLDNLITYRVLKGRYNLVASPYIFTPETIPDDVDETLNILNGAIGRILSEVWAYCNEIMKDMTYFRLDVDRMNEDMKEAMRKKEEKDAGV